MRRIAFASIVAVGIGTAGTAWADDDLVNPNSSIVRAQIDGGPMEPAPGLGASVSGGWGGAHAQAIGDITAEALISGRFTIRAGVDYENGKGHAAATASFIIFDPTQHQLGLLVGIALKNEGLTEADGEVELTVAASREIGAGLLSGSVTYGQDPDFHDHDGEAALSLVEPLAKSAAIGGVTRFRDGLGSAADLGANWDGLAGVVARAQFAGVYQVTAIAGAEVIGVADDAGGGTKSGFLGTIAVGAWW